MNRDQDESGLHTGDLVDRAREGDAEALGALYRMYEKRLEIAVRRRMSLRMRGRMEPSDLIQSVWKDALKDVADFDYRGPDSFFRWMLSRIIHKIQDKGRYLAAGKRDLDRERPLARPEDSGGEAAALPSRDPTPSRVAMNGEDLNRLLGFLDRLPDAQRQALVLRMRDDLEFQRIGEIMGRSADAVRKLYARAVKRVGELMGHVRDESDEYPFGT